jgi:hypothetical protein
MELKIFDRNNCLQSTHEPTISIHKTGLISLSMKCCEITGLSENDLIVIAQDKDSKKDWYIVKDTKNGFHLYKEGNALKFHSRLLVHELYDVLKTSSGSFRMLVSHEPVKDGEKTLWLIITASAREVFRRTKK